MKREQLYDAIGLIDDDILQETDLVRRTSPVRNVKRPKFWSAVAACLCMAVSIGSFVLLRGQNLLEETGLKYDPVMTDGIYIPKIQVTMPKDVLADMMAFFIYQGKSYVHNGFVRQSQGAEALVGEYLGTAKATFKCYSTENVYEEFAGTVQGDFYSVNGYDREFMLCMKEETAVSLFIDNNGITLKTGEDLFGTRLHIKNRYMEISAQSFVKWQQSDADMLLFDGLSQEEADRFIEALYQASCVVPEDMLPKVLLYFTLDDGITVRLCLYEGGYVSFDGITGVYFKIDHAIFDSVYQKALLACK